MRLRDGGRIVTGFGSGGDYPFDDFFDDVDDVGLVVELRLSTWDLRPFTAGVGVPRRSARPAGRTPADG